MDSGQESLDSRVSSFSETGISVSDLDPIAFSSFLDSTSIVDSAPIAAPAIPKPAMIFALSFENLVLAIVTTASDLIFQIALAGARVTKGS